MRSLSSVLLFLSLAIAACAADDDRSDGLSDGGGAAGPDGVPGGSGGGTAGVGGAGVTSPSPALPAPTGICPPIQDGDVMFAPAGIPPRKVKLALGDAANAPGSLVLYWHATGSAPAEAVYALGETLAEIASSGGIVAAPYADSTAGVFEWFIVNQSPKMDDFLVADEVVGRLAQAEMIDARRVHSMGMSAGALQTTAFSFLRAGYVASVATYSGGMPPGFAPSSADPKNLFAALIFHGGASDDVFGLDFAAASETYRATLVEGGHFAAICDHGAGHEIPLDAAPSVAAFFAANPYGAWPSPYDGAGLPASFPAYCSR